MRTRVHFVAMVAIQLLLSSVGGAQGGACTATLATKTPVRMPDGGSVFVEPQAVVTSGKRILVAGNPTYVWSFQDGRVSGAARDSIFGIVVDGGGRAKAVPSPLPPGRVHAVRAAAHGNGQWAVVFVEAAPLPKPTAIIKVEAYWFGVTDGARWLRMERLPAVQGQMTPDYASSLVRTVRGYAFAVPTLTPDGDRAAVFSERGGRWSVELVGDGGTYTSLATDGRELMLAAVNPDTVGRDSTKAWEDKNSLLLYRTREQGTKWASRARLIRGANQPVHHPELMWTGRGLEVAWMAHGGIGGELRIAAIAAADTLAFTSTLARGTQHIGSTTGPRGRPLWVTMNVGDGAADTQTLHVWMVHGGAGRQLIGVPTAFDGVVGLSALGSSLVVIGPVRGATPADAPVSLHMHAFTMNCD